MGEYADFAMLLVICAQTVAIWLLAFQNTALKRKLSLAADTLRGLVDVLEAVCQATPDEDETVEQKAA